MKPWNKPNKLIFLAAMKETKSVLSGPDGAAKRLESNAPPSSYV